MHNYTVAISSSRVATKLFTQQYYTFCVLALYLVMQKHYTVYAAALPLFTLWH